MANDGAIIDAVSGHNVDAVKALLKDNPELVHVRTPHGYCLLWRAWDIRIAEILLEYGCNVNHQNPAGETVLHGFAAYGSTKMALLYLRHGANPYLRNQQGNTAEFYCRHKFWIHQETAHGRWIRIQSVTVLVTLIAINNRRKVDGNTTLQTELFRYLQFFLTDITQ